MQQLGALLLLRGAGLPLRLSPGCFLRHRISRCPSWFVIGLALAPGALPRFARAAQYVVRVLDGLLAHAAARLGLCAGLVELLDVLKGRSASRRRAQARAEEQLGRLGGERGAAEVEQVGAAHVEVGLEGAAGGEQLGRLGGRRGAAEAEQGEAEVELQPAGDAGASLPGQAGRLLLSQAPPSSRT
jgi:hypothetical protein